MSRPIRILFLADSHLGLDLPANPRVARRRRGHDFLANHEAALAHALHCDIDLVVHGGDVFDRPRISPALAHRAYHPLLRIAARGVPVCIVPGNHERGQLPHARFLGQPNIHVFDRPRTFAVAVRGARVVLGGFPYERRNVRSRFPDLVERTGWRDEPADVRLLCIHHCVEGATVGPGDFMFTSAPDVIRCRDLPAGFAAVLSGHIHRHQVLTHDLRGVPLRTPVLYPGSIERTSAAEIGESKGCLILELERGGVRWEFRPLPARPMIVRQLAVSSGNAGELDAAIRGAVRSAPRDAVLRIRVDGSLTAAQLHVISAAHVRSFTPDSMNVEIRADQLLRARAVREPRSAGARGRKPDENLQLGL